MCEKIHAIMAWETLYFPSFFFYHDHHNHGGSHCFSSQDLGNLVQSNLIMLKYIKIHSNTIYTMYLFDYFWQSLNKIAFGLYTDNT